ncbi:uncharacterized protein LOC136764431 isoform X2 [Amia ocellicauda]|uniref:uncharacterized protein LOC136764431 isoform X2 n=1 Tax=Amia ocellicauda TaxID=2972642 RepID=UPI0034645CF3
MAEALGSLFEYRDPPTLDSDGEAAKPAPPPARGRGRKQRKGIPVKVPERLVTEDDEDSLSEHSYSGAQCVGVGGLFPEGAGGPEAALPPPEIPYYMPDSLGNDMCVPELLEGVSGSGVGLVLRGGGLFHPPNCRVGEVRCGGGRGRLCVLALRDISKGEEITVDYSQIQHWSTLGFHSGVSPAGFDCNSDLENEGKKEDGRGGAPVSVSQYLPSWSLSPSSSTSHSTHSPPPAEQREGAGREEEEVEEREIVEEEEEVEERGKGRKRRRSLRKRQRKEESVTNNQHSNNHSAIRSTSTISGSSSLYPSSNTPPVLPAPPPPPLPPSSLSLWGSDSRRHRCLFCRRSYRKLGRHLERAHPYEQEVTRALAHRRGSRERAAILRELRVRGDCGSSAFPSSSSSSFPSSSTFSSSSSSFFPPPSSSSSSSFFSSSPFPSFASPSLQFRTDRERERLQSSHSFVQPLPTTSSSTSTHPSLPLSLSSSDFLPCSSCLALCPASELGQHQMNCPPVTAPWGKRRSLKSLEEEEGGRVEEEEEEEDDRERLRQRSTLVSVCPGGVGRRGKRGGGERGMEEEEEGQGEAVEEVEEAEAQGRERERDGAGGGETRGEEELFELREMGSPCSSSPSPPIQNPHQRPPAPPPPLSRPHLLPLLSDLSSLTRLLLSKQQAARAGLQQQQHLRQRHTNGGPAVPPSLAELWRSLCQSSLALLILFNRGREVEVSKLLVSAYQQRGPGREPASEGGGVAPERGTGRDTEVGEEGLSGFERAVLWDLPRAPVQGKRGKCLPLLFTPQMEQSLDLLIHTRAQVGVGDENPLVFARPFHSSSTPLRGGDVLRLLSRSSPARRPQNLTCLRLRPQIGLLSQLLWLSDGAGRGGGGGLVGSVLSSSPPSPSPPALLSRLQGYLDRECGVTHDLSALGHDPQLLGKLGRVLLSAERHGRLFRGLSLDHVCLELDVLSENSVDSFSEEDEEEEERERERERDMERAVGVAGVAGGEVGGGGAGGGCGRRKRTFSSKPQKQPPAPAVPPPSRRQKQRRPPQTTGAPSPSPRGNGKRNGQPKPGKRGVQKRPWSEEERRAVEGQLERNIRLLRVPAKAECEGVLQRCPLLASNQRDWRAVKFYVHNRIQLIKRRLTRGEGAGGGV